MWAGASQRGRARHDECMARYAPGQRCFCVRIDTRGRITIPKPARDALGWQAGDEIVVRVEGDVAILSKRGEPHGHSLEETLEALAGVRARLRGRGLDAVAVVREGRRELERRSWEALGRWDAAFGRGTSGSNLRESEAISDQLTSPNSSENAGEQAPGCVRPV
jgi:AbrB family looped-hinge helix DNA binding protein